MAASKQRHSSRTSSRGLWLLAGFGAGLAVCALSRPGNRISSVACGAVNKLRGLVGRANGTLASAGPAAGRPRETEPLEPAAMSMPEAAPAISEREVDVVAEASEESFPASDAPGWIKRRV